MASLLLGVGFTEEVYDLGRIEVMAKGEHKPMDTNSTLTNITAQDIANTSSQNVAEALRYMPGVFFQPATGQRGEPSIGIRGYSTTHIGLFIDGIPVHSIYDRQTDWAQFSTFGIAEINVSKGYTSPIYGMNTLGGAVNIVTSKPKDALELNAGYTSVSNNEDRAFAQVGTNMGKYYFQLGYAYDGRDSYNLSSKFTPTAYQPKAEKLNSYYTNHTLRVKAGFEPNENHEYSLNLIYQKGDKGGMFNANTGGNFWKWPHYDKITAYILGNSRFNDMLSLNSRIYYDRIL